MRNLPTRRSSRRAASRSASGEGRCSISRRGSAIHIRYYQIGGSDNSPLGASIESLSACLVRDGALTRQLIERDIKQKHIDARLAEKAEQTPLSVVGNKLADTVFRLVARLGDAGHLEEGGLRRDVRVKPARRCRDQIVRHRH